MGGMLFPMIEGLADWIDGRRIDLRGRKKLLRAAGVLSRTGDAARQLGGFSRYLERTRGFVPEDFLEVTYRGRLNGAEWVPCPYEATDCDVPLVQSTALVARQLRWYDTRLPADIELHLIGYSLGGVVLFGAAVALLTEEPARWRNRLRSLITLSSPHFGCDLGLEGEVLGLLGVGALFLPGDSVGRELCTLGGSAEHRARVEREARFLASQGIRLLTLADENDVVVTPDDAVITPPAARARYTFSSSRARIGGAYEDAVLGHGPLLDNPKAWAMMAEVIGPQEPRVLRTASGAIPL